eukprot:jgi/Hompol1/4828/HPOL_003988-RA
MVADSNASTIKIYARVRPQRPNARLKATQGRYWVSNPSHSSGADASDDDVPRIGFHIPRNESAGLINNQKESYEFKFDRLFDVDASQEEVFDVVAKPVIQSLDNEYVFNVVATFDTSTSSLEGYNGTIFAYGQASDVSLTGSGKTFTITGGAERYADRGLIPRTLQFLFKEAQKSPHIQYTFQVSYLEIYNEVGYDLLDSGRDAKKLEDLPKVTLQEDADEMIHLRNLSVVQAASEEDALNLLFVGDTNRMIAETPSNPSSSRSHCIFIIGITSRRSDEDVIRRSKLHLVDLAGSERVGRTGIDGTLLKEAKYINLSLHYLEQVIIALHEQSLGKRSHVPYRNSMMTSVLRDSLGGNCKTTMIATVAVEDQLIDESISTCRFAQRVALISNNATLNEEIDPRLLIARLKNEIAKLKAELAIARGETSSEIAEDLPDYEKQRVKNIVDDYIADTSPDAVIILSDFRKIQHAFRVLKKYLAESRHGQKLEDGSEHSVENSSMLGRDAASKISINTQGLSNDQLQQFEKLKTLVAHRDNEINILVGMITQLKARQGNSSAGFDLQTLKSLEKLSSSQQANLAASLPSLTTEKAKAFEIFRSGYPSSEWIDGQKALLKHKYAEAKSLGEAANKLRTEIKSLKEQLANASTDFDKESHRSVLMDRVAKYKQAYESLKDMKLEIEHLQHLLEQARHRLTRDFEHWYINVYLPTETTHGSYSHGSDAVGMETGMYVASQVASPAQSLFNSSPSHSLQSIASLTAPSAGAAAAATGNLPLPIRKLNSDPSQKTVHHYSTSTSIDIGRASQGKEYMITQRVAQHQAYRERHYPLSLL